MHGLVQIAPLPPVPLHDLFTYRVPEPLRPPVRPGRRVRMPLGRQTRTGVVAGFVDVAPPGELRPILDVLDADPFVPPDLLELCRWTAGYYLASLAEVLAAVVPVALPAPGRERVVRLLRRLTPEEEAALARRAPARARAYRVLCAAPGGELGGPAARAAGLRPPAPRAPVAAGLAGAGARPRPRPPGRGNGGTRGGGAATAAGGSWSGRARPSSRRFHASASWSSTRSTTRPTSRRTGCATTRATWGSCAPGWPARWWCSPRQRRRPRATTPPVTAVTCSSSCPTGRPPTGSRRSSSCVCAGGRRAS